jgi:1-acyl-sn-glycerol-3-phosphate acyltransferase
MPTARAEPGRRRPPGTGAPADDPAAAPGAGPRAALGRTGAALVRGLARALVALFYRRVEVVGLEHVPPRGGLVVAANHWNAIVDPLLLLATLPRPLRPLAKAPLFRHPLLGPFLRLAGALPVERRQDPGSDPARNASMFRAAGAALGRGEALLIFPEGVSQPEPVLMPLRTGVARLALGTEAGAAGPPVALLPVGLTFHDPGTFRAGWALVLIGPPVPLDDCRAGARQDPEGAVRALTARLGDALRRLVTEAEDRDTLRLAEGLEALRRAEAPERDGPAAAAELAERAAWVRRALRAYGWLAARDPARVTALRPELERHLADLGRLGVTPAEVGRQYPAAAVRRYALREGMALLGTLPLAAWGLAVHALPYALTALVARWLAGSADVLATVKLGAGLVLYPACWALEAWAVARLGGPWALAVFLATLGPAGLVALGWQARVARVRRDARAYLRFLGDRDLLARLAARRRALVAETETLARLVPRDVLDGEGAGPR